MPGKGKEGWKGRRGCQVGASERYAEVRGKVGKGGEEVEARERGEEEEGTGRVPPSGHR